MNQVTTEQSFNISALSLSDDDPAVPGFSVAARTDPFSAAQQQARYTSYTIDTEYPTDTGIRVLPTSGGTGAGVRVRVHMGVTQKIVKWTAERLGAHPVLPGPNTGDPNEVLVDALFYPASAYQLFNNIIYRASGVYTYKLLQPKMPGDSGSTYPIGSSPAEIARSRDRFYNYRDFDNTVLDASALRDTGRRANMDIPVRTVQRQEA